MTNSYPSGSPDSHMPTGAPGFAPRRSSYASVVSGTASGISQQRSGAFSHLVNPQTDFSFDPTYQSLNGHSRHDLRQYDMDYNTNGGGHGLSGSWGRGGQLPSFSSAFGSILNGQTYNGFGGGYMDHFFVPSYLKGSNYVQKLEQAHKAKIFLAHKDGHSAHSSQPGSLSTSASSINLHTKMAPSHRGMTFDLIEKAPHVDDEALVPLPSKWNISDKNDGLEVLSDGQEVKFVGPKSDSHRDHAACAIRADHPMPPQCGIYYFEVTIISRKREESSIGIGFSSKNVPLSRLPGWEPESWAYHGDDGNSFCCHSTGKTYGPPFNAGDIIGCGINFKTNSAFFTKNGDHLGAAFRDIKFREIKGKLYPTVGMKKTGEHIRVNFGQTPFLYDIDGMMSDEKSAIRQEIEATSTAKLAPPLGETELIQSLVVQFLVHEGYVETARAFADDVHEEKVALNLDPNVTIPAFNVKEDLDAGHRQRIRAAILDGDVDTAFYLTNKHYPDVLKSNERVNLRLKCLRIVEMHRRLEEKQNARSRNGNKKSNGHNGDWYDDILNHDMDLDDLQSQANNWDRMDTEDSSNSQPEVALALQEILNYTKELTTEFQQDPRLEIKKEIETVGALIAHERPSQDEAVKHLMDPSRRVADAEELNSAILQSLGKSSSSALEKLYQHTSVLLGDLQEAGGSATFVNIDDFVHPKPGP